jgi:O-antigen/teichoic acid export membrane protein
VAKYRAAGDVLGVNRIVSSATCLLGFAGLLAMGLTIAVSLLLPKLFGNRLGENAQEARWVVLFLGASLAIQIALAVFSGVLTGCHRWELHNINTSGWHAATVAGMIVALLLGGRLWILAAITLAGETLAGVRRMVLAYGSCEGLRLRLSLVKWATVGELFAFGGKTLIPSVSNVLLNSTTSILIIAYLGPAALAMYSRPRSLVNQAEVLVRKMAMTLTPTISSLESTGDLSKIRDLLTKSTRYSCYLALPIVLVLVVFGGPIMQLWMGSRYANGLVPAILAIGYLSVLVQIPAWNIFVGLNAHGRIGVARLIASASSVGLNVLVVAYLKWGLVGTAAAVTLPLMILNLVDIPLLVCRRLGLDLKRYFLSVTVGPAIHVLPFAICIVVARLVFQTKPLMGLVLGGAVGGAVLAVLYWRYVLPDQVKTLVLYYPCKVMRLAGMLKTRESVTQQVEEH